MTTICEQRTSQQNDAVDRFQCWRKASESKSAAHLTDGIHHSTLATLVSWTPAKLMVLKSALAGAGSQPPFSCPVGLTQPKGCCTFRYHLQSRDCDGQRADLLRAGSWYSS